MENLKYGVFVLWFGSLAAMFLGDATVAHLGQVTFWGTMAVHLLEFAWKRPLFVRAGGDMAHHFLQTMLYGLFYWKPIEDRLGSR